ncbi:MAG: hypothetical protein H6704_24735 [Myxococcales bacterium]|nr:hypothetical protein [Myxococcales bacterium]MCB9539433.1 hypothetical protein [Myxococcales bacterium]
MSTPNATLSLGPLSALRALCDAIAGFVPSIDTWAPLKQVILAVRPTAKLLASAEDATQLNELIDDLVDDGELLRQVMRALVIAMADPRIASSVSDAPDPEEHPRRRSAPGLDALTADRIERYLPILTRAHAAELAVAVATAREVDPDHEAQNFARAIAALTDSALAPPFVHCWARASALVVVLPVVAAALCEPAFSNAAWVRPHVWRRYADALYDGLRVKASQPMISIPEDVVPRADRFDVERELAQAEALARRAESALRPGDDAAESNGAPLFRELHDA